VSRIPSDVPVSPGARPQQVSRSDFVPEGKAAFDGVKPDVCLIADRSSD
jgi:hypothetical protein